MKFHGVFAIVNVAFPGIYYQWTEHQFPIGTFAHGIYRIIYRILGRVFTRAFPRTLTRTLTRILGRALGWFLT